MRTLVESLKRLYKSKRITDDRIAAMMEAGTITAEEMQYILEQKDENPA